MSYDGRPTNVVAGTRTTRQIPTTRRSTTRRLSTLASATGYLFPFSVTALSPVGNLSGAYNWSLGIQRDIGFQTVVDVSYVGNVGRHLQVGPEPEHPAVWNAIPPAESGCDDGQTAAGQVPGPVSGLGLDLVEPMGRQLELQLHADAGESPAVARSSALECHGLGLSSWVTPATCRRTCRCFSPGGPGRTGKPITTEPTTSGSTISGSCQRPARFGTPGSSEESSISWQISGFTTFLSGQGDLGISYYDRFGSRYHRRRRWLARASCSPIRSCRRDQRTDGPLLQYRRVCATALRLAGECSARRLPGPGDQQLGHHLLQGHPDQGDAPSSKFAGSSTMLSTMSRSRA